MRIQRVPLPPFTMATLGFPPPLLNLKGMAFCTPSQPPGSLGMGLKEVHCKIWKTINEWSTMSCSRTAQNKVVVKSPALSYSEATDGLILTLGAMSGKALHTTFVCTARKLEVKWKWIRFSYVKCSWRKHETWSGRNVSPDIFCLYFNATARNAACLFCEQNCMFCTHTHPPLLTHCKWTFPIEGKNELRDNFRKHPFSPWCSNQIWSSLQLQ